MNTVPRVFSLNVGTIRRLEFGEHVVTTGIWKYPVQGRVQLRGVNFVGDDQADRTVHGGPDKAVYAYSQEDYAYWRDEEDVEVLPGLFGENITTEGIDLNHAIVGAQWTVGTTILEIAQPRLPCYKLGLRMGDRYFVKRFMAAQRMGAYLRVIQEGEIGAGDGIVISQQPQHGITLRNMVDALNDSSSAIALRQIPRLPKFWRQVADEG